MTRSYSPVAQLALRAELRLQQLSSSTPLPIRLLARAVNKFARPLARRHVANRLVDEQVYGRQMRMPAEHQLPLILRGHPQFNRPLALAVSALAAAESGAPLTVVDVGANIGETIAVIEQRNPGLCSYLCIEADSTLAELCRFNHMGNPRVQTVQCFIGEEEGAAVRLEDDGRASPSTKLIGAADPTPGSSCGRLVRLDTIVRPFAEEHGSLSLVKVDVEGYDFSVLRSSVEMLQRYHPALYFEWYPELLQGIGENVLSGFDFLASLGYEHLILFTSIGDYYCDLNRPDRTLLQNLARAVARNRQLVYFDVFASTSASVCNRLVDLSLSS